MPGYTVVSIEPDRALVTHIDDENAASWVWVLDPIDAETTRLIVRFRQKWEPGLMGLAIWIGDELGSLVMQPKTLRGSSSGQRLQPGSREQAAHDPVRLVADQARHTPCRSDGDLGLALIAVNRGESGQEGIKSTNGWRL